ncbi:MAG TPA: helix-turn-helix transcriptional regulator [Pirellulaceae bacterium]|nr:helix-turn-helix transcriptional regulator [Pirellulaceae bacterium]
MGETLLHDDAITLARLDSVACLLEWLQALPESARQRFAGVLSEDHDGTQQLVTSLLDVVKNPESTAAERQQALRSISQALFSPDSSQQATFAQRLRELMEAKQISQQELAGRAGCSQPAISQLLQRECRPRKNTILKLAAALQVSPQALWPDMEAAELLDAVADFQQDGYVMTTEEARALSDHSQRNPPKIQPKSLPARHR